MITEFTQNMLVYGLVIELVVGMPTLVFWSLDKKFQQSIRPALFLFFFNSSILTWAMYAGFIELLVVPPGLALTLAILSTLGWFILIAYILNIQTNWAGIMLSGMGYK